MMGGSLIPTAVLLLFVGVLAVDADVKRVYWDVVAGSCNQRSHVTERTVVCSVTPSTKKSVTDGFPFYHASTNGELEHTDPNKVMIFSSHNKDVIGAHVIVNSGDFDKSKGVYFYDLKSDLDSLNIIMMDYYLSKRVGKSIGDERSFFGKGHGVDYLTSFMGDFEFQKQSGELIDHHGWYNEWDQDESVFAVEYAGKTMVDFHGDPDNFKPLDTVIPFVLVHCHDQTRPDCADDYDLYMTGFEENKAKQTTAKSVAQLWLEGTGQQSQVDFTFTVGYFDSDGKFVSSTDFKEQRPAKLTRVGPPRDHAVQEGASSCTNCEQEY